ncbi:MAG: hypothetical protein ACK5YO_31140 [Planctomyces sp.]
MQPRRGESERYAQTGSDAHDSRFFAKKVIGGSDWPLRCQTPAVRRSLHVKPGSQRNPRDDFRRRQSSQTLSPGEHRDVDARPASHLATPKADSANTKFDCGVMVV